MGRLVLDQTFVPIPIPLHDFFVQMAGCKALEVFLKLKPRKYKYKAYITISAEVLSRSTMAIERRGKSAAIALSS